MKLRIRNRISYYLYNYARVCEGVNYTLFYTQPNEKQTVPKKSLLITTKYT